MAEQETTFTLTKSEALALDRVADIGIRVARELNLIQSLETAERARRKVAGHDVDARRAPAGMTYQPKTRPARKPSPPGRSG